MAVIICKTRTGKFPFVINELQQKWRARGLDNNFWRLEREGAEGRRRRWGGMGYHKRVTTTATHVPTLLVHGGAWAIPQDAAAAHEAGVRAALEAGYAMLTRGGTGAGRGGGGGDRAGRRPDL